MAEMRNIYKILAGNLEGKSTLGRPRRRKKDNIQSKEMGYGLDLSGLE
jgi:hypothetical protein